MRSIDMPQKKSLNDFILYLSMVKHPSIILLAQKKSTIKKYIIIQPTTHITIKKLIILKSLTLTKNLYLLLSMPIKQITNLPQETILRKPPQPHLWNIILNVVYHQDHLLICSDLILNSKLKIQLLQGCPKITLKSLKN